ncbi:unnamed protein product [Merluccius merluccius]
MYDRPHAPVDHHISSVLAPQQTSPSKVSLSLGKGDIQTPPSSGLRRTLEGGDQEEETQEGEEGEEGDSFFDDPLPRPQKTYGCHVTFKESPVGSVSERAPGGTSGGASSSSGGPRERAPGGTSGGASSSSGGPRERAPGGTSGGASSSSGGPRERAPGGTETRTSSDKHGSQLLDDDPEYDDDFNSHRSDISRSELSIGEEIEEVSIEGPNDSHKDDEDTQDLSVSQMSQSLHADYIEDVA